MSKIISFIIKNDQAQPHAQIYAVYKDHPLFGTEDIEKLRRQNVQALISFGVLIAGRILEAAPQEIKDNPKDWWVFILPFNGTGELAEEAEKLKTLLENIK